MKTISIFCAVLLLIACFQLPMAYYTFLRVVITIGAIISLLNQMKKDVSLTGICFIITTILFNPLIPIYLYNKAIWISVDICTSGLFLISGFREKE